jgi:hypothetical protein
LHHPAFEIAEIGEILRHLSLLDLSIFPLRPVAQQPVTYSMIGINLCVRPGQVLLPEDVGTPTAPPDGRVQQSTKLQTMIEIDATLVKQLVRTQFPHWADLPVVPVENGGWDNRTFRLGDSTSARPQQVGSLGPGAELWRQGDKAASIAVSDLVSGLP